MTATNKDMTEVDASEKVKIGDHPPHLSEPYFVDFYQNSKVDLLKTSVFWICYLVDWPTLDTAIQARRAHTRNTERHMLQTHSSCINQSYFLAHSRSKEYSLKFFLLLRQLSEILFMSKNQLMVIWFLGRLSFLKSLKWFSFMFVFAQSPTKEVINDSND